jgi:hypothetical protein
MHRSIINLYDRCWHGAVSRRQCFDRLAELAGGSAVAAALMPAAFEMQADAHPLPDVSTPAAATTAKTTYVLWIGG